MNNNNTFGGLLGSLVGGIVGGVVSVPVSVGREVGLGVAQVFAPRGVIVARAKAMLRALGVERSLRNTIARRAYGLTFDQAMALDPEAAAASIVQAAVARGEVTAPAAAPRAAAKAAKAQARAEKKAEKAQARAEKKTSRAAWKAA